MFLAVARLAGATTVSERVCPAFGKRNNVIVGWSQFGGEWSFAPMAVF